MYRGLIFNPNYVTWKTFKKYLCMDHTIVEVISELMVVTGVNIAFAMRASGIQSQKSIKLISPVDILHLMIP